jgi:hypothetical protein
MPPETQPDTIQWSGYEHQPLEKSSDWFWALGIVAVAAAAASIILGNILFGILILAAATAISILARRDAKLTTFSLSKKGLFIDDVLYPVDHLKGFWINEHDEDSVLLIDTPRFMTPDLVIPLEGVNEAAVRNWFVERNIEEKELRESFSLKLLEFFGY